MDHVLEIMTGVSTFLLGVAIVRLFKLSGDVIRLAEKQNGFEEWRKEHLSK